MRSSTEIIETLKQARRRKQLSQIELAERAGLTQSYVSRLESGTIDLRLSTLMELSRALDLEPVLVPQSFIPTVEALQRTRSPRAESLEGMDRQLARPAYSLEDDEEDGMSGAGELG